jgi:hypothetical protein
MGLEDFMDMSGGSDNDGEDEQSGTSSQRSTTSGAETTSREEKLLKRDNWIRDEDGKVRPRGPYGYSTRDEYNKTVKGEVVGEDVQFKHKAPIMTRIDDREPLEEGARYKHRKAHAHCNCIMSERRELQEIPRECVMLDTGEPEKSDALDVLEDRMGFRPEDGDEVTLTVFINTRHAVKIALGEGEIDQFGAYSKDNILKAVHGEAYTQRFREKDGELRDVRHTDEIQMW